MTLEEMIALTKQLQAEIQMYEVVIQTQGGASTSREHHSSQFLNQLGEIKEWCPRSLDAITKALENCRKRRPDDQGRSDSRDDIAGTLLYLKDKVLSIERKAVRVLERKTREVSGGSYERMPKDDEGALMQRGSAGTASTATLRQDGRDNPFNQVVNGLGSASRIKASDHRIPDTAQASGISSVNRRIEDPSYASSIKKGGHRESYRAFDEPRDSEQ